MPADEQLKAAREWLHQLSPDDWCKEEAMLDEKGARELAEEFAAPYEWNIAALALLRVQAETLEWAGKRYPSNIAYELSRTRAAIARLETPHA